MGGSPDSPIPLSDSEKDDTIPAKPASSPNAAIPEVYDNNPRRSLQCTVKGDNDPIPSKAQKRKQTSGSNNTGIQLLNSFSYSRLTVDHIVELFRVYQISLGTTLDDCKIIIASIQQMDQARFEIVIKNLLSQPRKEHQLAQLDLQQLVVTETNIVIK